MDLISLIIIISVIAKIFKKNKPEKYEDVKSRAKALGKEVVGELRGSVNAKHANTYKMPKQSTRTTPAYEQVNKSRMEAKNTTILQRAKTNADEDKEDVTLRSLEESHGHSAHVAPAIHNHPEDVIPENVLGTVEDLMVKGYEGSLCFERDFVGEAMDMVARFSLGGTAVHES